MTLDTPEGVTTINPDLDLVDGYACPIDPAEAALCESCQ